MSTKQSGQTDTGVALDDEVKLQPPKMYKVMLHNDDYTTMEFVIHILQKFFQKNRQEAQSIMLEVHTNGVAVCGIYTFEVAESKTAKVVKYARDKGHPLKCTYEPEE